MSLRDIFRKRKEAKKEIKTEKPQPQEKPEKKVKDVVIEKPKEKKISGIAYRILKSPRVTEKATDLAKINQYTFKVWERANKPQIRKAAEDLYGVDVVSVKIVNIPKKKRRLGKIEGWKKGYKKAVVKVKEGQKIEVLPR